MLLENTALPYHPCTLSGHCSPPILSNLCYLDDKPFPNAIIFI